MGDGCGCELATQLRSTVPVLWNFFLYSRPRARADLRNFTYAVEYECMACLQKGGRGELLIRDLHVFCTHN